MLHPRPDDDARTAEPGRWAALADDLERRVTALPDTRRVTTVSLHHSALHMRGATAPGPDGWSGDMVHRAARCFKRTMSTLLERYYRALRDTRDALLAHVLLDAVMLAFPKSKPGASRSAAPSAGGAPAPGPLAPASLRPISIAGAFARCVVAKVVTLSRTRLRKMLEPMGQYALTGTAAPIAQLMSAVAEC